ncbi:inosine-uridine preferring nucleoside hydrolase-like [Carassius auratus]|uniref:Inosine-uridine preferring nucleoside hydrolase-like n=1 Tax=Carassius auratus TaxID=7957 RepID=A0A6P6KC72_CARAU|nr:inosine-uridine preferring nucleoside hydrolase-like [Carassius auratus]XP_026069516.1 inosine-uridine preferring nucleoside hydrolase-like [Carassius auratus]XP_026069517.1 inosine-uridine preferring nucleoside hydrolase-like [Carassius auratus]
MAQKLLIMDTDCGIDDALAIIVALAAPGVKVLAITCCFGNTNVDNVCQNVMRVLTVCQQTQIPVFKGSAGALIRPVTGFKDHFGTDGLGDVLENSEVWKGQIQKEHAVHAMIRLVNENQGEVSLIALGPLTNLALAVRLDPSLPQKLKDLYIMGGNMEGKGNLTPSAEFNFSMDAESAHVVLEEYTCSTCIATWEFTCRNKLSWDCFEELVNQDTSAARFIKMITSKCWAYSREPHINNKDLLFGNGFVPYDAFAVAACVDSSVITEHLQCAVRVEVQGQLGRGMMVVDAANTLKKGNLAFVMRTCDLKKFSLMLKAALQIA